MNFLYRISYCILLCITSVVKASVITIDNQMDDYNLALIPFHYDKNRLIMATEIPLKRGSQEITIEDAVKELCIVKHDCNHDNMRKMWKTKDGRVSCYQASNRVLASPPCLYTFTAQGELLEGAKSDLKKQIRIYNNMNMNVSCKMWLVDTIPTKGARGKYEARRIFLKPGMQTVSVSPDQEIFIAHTIKESQWSSDCKFPPQNTKLVGQRVMPSVYSHYELTPQGKLIENTFSIDAYKKTSNFKAPAELTFRNNASFPVFLEGPLTGLLEPGTSLVWAKTVGFYVDDSYTFLYPCSSAIEHEHFWGPFAIHEAIATGPRQSAIGKQCAHGKADRTTTYIEFSGQEDLKIEPPYQETESVDEPTTIISLDNQLENASCGVILNCKDKDKDNIPCNSQSFGILVEPGLQNITLSEPARHIRILKMLCKSTDSSIPWQINTEADLSFPFSYTIDPSGELMDNGRIKTKSSMVLKALTIGGTAVLFLMLHRILNHNQPIVIPIPNYDPAAGAA